MLGTKPELFRTQYLSLENAQDLALCFWVSCRASLSHLGPVPLYPGHTSGQDDQSHWRPAAQICFFYFLFLPCLCQNSSQRAVSMGWLNDHKGLPQAAWGGAKSSATGTRARVARVRAEYPDQLDYSGCWAPNQNCSGHNTCLWRMRKI